ncbi:ATP-binding cassette domain-containing protein [Sciscionella sediminilitoris]|uniref:ATP-binding cassette domain-containing protein n=1 Tax=Sciscionella sediminilitoris TaxID=1445613 RepID=UPI0006899A34|nr:ATP-binding cassette domain-containing protein [Sciscionella sp. SE31]
MNESIPVLIADALSLGTKRGWVFNGVDLVVPTGSLTAVAGPSGSGRTMLLLALAGRAKPSSGTLRVLDERGNAELRRSAVREAVAVARVTGAAELEPDLRVIDHRSEAGMLAGKPIDYEWAAGVLGLSVDGAAFVGELPADDATLLAVALAAAAKPSALVVDDVDAQVTQAQQARIWAALAELSGYGVSVIASTHSADIARRYGAAVCELGATEEGINAGV